MSEEGGIDLEDWQRMAADERPKLAERHGIKRLDEDDLLALVAPRKLDGVPKDAADKP